MIYTLTTNPAIDMNIQSKEIQPSVVNRTESAQYFPNGKGINVSLVLKHYGIPSKALGFFGGFTGRYIVDELTNIGLGVEPIWLKEITRINVFVNDGINEFKFVNQGSFVPKEQQEKMLGLIKNLQNCSHLVVSGSLPPGIHGLYYDLILKACAERSIEVIMDISSPRMQGLLQYKPLLIKPNDEEIYDIFGIEINNELDARQTLYELKQLGARNVLLTLGEKGLYFFNGAKIYYCTTPKIQVLSSACAGDAALGAFLSEWLYKYDLESALKKASATGANVAESEGIGTLEKVDEYIKQIKVKEVI
ncbi:carbohydrate kinase pfkb [Lucifera butyrica]|uniref:Tagatose-6-phosphate kinase n=1 Tax=Lucifera butyrica TaxID=1351585 RepID=A0A498R773_9FIRM|nr:1-phosphofructokinase family hexose kinase [Lucifera butyrica]VBB07221.1 carbohydrate kinase pfkb [Lucifera butyrica]